MSKRKLKQTNIADEDAPNKKLRKLSIHNSQLPFRLQLKDLNGIDPLTIKFDYKNTIDDITQILKKKVKIYNGWLYFPHKFTPNNKVPMTFNVEISNQNIINFAANEFKISSNTRFIQYWNDFLDEAKMYHEEKKQEKNKDDIKCEGDLCVTLKDDILSVGDVKITFERTLRIPDDNKTYPIPPSLGKFPLVQVQDYLASDAIPHHWKTEKGVMLPMWQKEAMFIQFSSSNEC